MKAMAAEPKKYFFALSSGGSAGHVATLAFLKRTGLPLDTILYKGTAPANTDLMAGNVQLFMDPWTALLPLATSGRARGLFVTSKERTSLAPNIPTSDEVGLKDFNISSWYGVWAPKATPDAIVDRLAAGMAEVSRDPQFLQRTASLGIVPTARGPADFAAFIKTEVDTNTALLRDAGYKPE
jgi:tripartite-type tricarboxylate transporter receptor subunit TctC